MSFNGMFVWFITGANRGIGLEMTKQLLEASQTVIATARDPSKATALQELAKGAKGSLHVLTLEVTDSKSAAKCAEETARILGSRGIDYLVNNAGVATMDTAFTLKLEDLKRIIDTNLYGPIIVSQAFVPLVEKSTKKTILNISSALGSKGLEVPVEIQHMFTSYGISKAALNMVQSKERRELTVVSFEPGHLQTDLGGPHAPHPVSVGVEGVLKVVASLTPEKSGQFLDFTGKNLPW
ncbi:sniffer [Daedaleopsis nitida]|nr:sniffer [Daedaleopsis nitida]